jgi:putative copper resistance protein D
MNLLIHSMPLWLELTALVFCIGGLALLLWVFPERKNDAPLSRDHNRLLWIFIGVAVLAAMTGSVADILVRTAEMSGDPILSAIPSLPTVVFKSHVGRVWLIRMTVFLIMLILLMTGKERRNSKMFVPVLFCLGALVALTESASGHPADKGDFSIAEIMDWLHLLAASAWGGGLFALSLAISPDLHEEGGQTAPSFSEFAARFSRMAGIAVCIIAGTAVYNAWVYVGSIEAAVKSFYGWTITVKIVLFLLLLFLGAINRYVNVPDMVKSPGLPEGKPGIGSRFIRPVLLSVLPDRKDRPAVRRFSRAVRIEAFLMVAILLCAALLRHEVPAKHYLHQHEKGRIHPHMHGGTR